MKNWIFGAITIIFILVIAGLILKGIMPLKAEVKQQAQNLAGQSVKLKDKDSTINYLISREKSVPRWAFESILEEKVEIYQPIIDSLYTKRDSAAAEEVFMKIAYEVVQEITGDTTRLRYH